KNALFPERKRTNPHTKYVTSRRPQRPQKSGVARTVRGADRRSPKNEAAKRTRQSFRADRSFPCRFDPATALPKGNARQFQRAGSSPGSDGEAPFSLLP